MALTQGSQDGSRPGRRLPKYKLQPGEYLVVYNRDPGDTILAGGMNIEDVAAGTQVNKGSSHAVFHRRQNRTLAITSPSAFESSV